MDDLPRDENRTTRNVIIAILAVLALVVILFLLGVFDVDTQGDLEAPEVQVEGGQLPDVDADAADIDVGVANETVRVPEVDVQMTNETVQTPTIDVNAAEADEE